MCSWVDVMGLCSQERKTGRSLLGELTGRLLEVFRVILLYFSSELLINNNLHCLCLLLNIKCVSGFVIVSGKLCEHSKQELGGGGGGAPVEPFIPDLPSMSSRCVCLFLPSQWMTQPICLPPLPPLHPPSRLGPWHQVHPHTPVYPHSERPDDRVNGGESGKDA